ncbi:MAG: M28 family peptidase [Gemmatimonadetes bacterium]|nr:M28 family peptidase [Gemmatimonadota bacterium]NNM05233.1 M28 family peptidase [Gemmatimonadota bacterium]
MPARTRSLQCLLLSGIAAIGLAITVSCSAPEPASPPTQIHTEAVDTHIRYLSSDDLKGRDAFSEEIALAEDYIAERFREAGLSEFPEFPGFKNRFSFEYRPRRNPDAAPVTYELQNIVGFVEGTDPDLKEEYILFGAHHDHLGVRGEAPDNIYNGADDNAAGTTAVIALAEYFARTHTNKRSLIFATFTAEEKGLIGARHLAANLPIQPDQLVCMVNFEMIGKPAADGSWNLMYLGPEASTLDEIFLEAVDQDSEITLVGPEEHQIRYFRASDNAAFHAEGFITTTLASPQSTDDPYYHRPNDHYEFLNIDYMTEVIRTVVDITEPLVSGEATPVRTGGGDR